MIKHYFSNILSGDGWQQDLLMTVDPSGRISALAEGSAADADYSHSGYAVPGMANVHSHAFQRAMAGLAEVSGEQADSFWSWRNVMYSFLGEINPDQLQAIASQLYVEMLKAGFTSVGEFHYLHNDINGQAFSDRAEMSKSIVAAAQETSIGLTLLPVLYQYSGFGAAEPKAQQYRFTQSLDQFVMLIDELQKRAGVVPGMNVGVAPHSLRAVDPESLAELMNSIPKSMPCHIHIAEQMREVTDCQNWSGQRPVEWLSNNVELSNRWCLIHATHVLAEEVASVAQSGAVVGLCPITEANLGDGIFPAGDFMNRGGKIALGSDSNILVSLAEECRLLEYGQRLTLQSRNILGSMNTSTGEQIFTQAVSGGHQALGRPGNAGLEIGGRGSFAILDPKHPAIIGKPTRAIIDSWLFAGDNSVVKDVAIDGKLVVVDGHHSAEEAILNRFGTVMAELVASL
ncbi:formimidoylglutamate deiminase [Sneathiella marina]|uniref:Formimidoylglutamate deiminase n=1 Tax=Sneathiella marina TaxID=2950108 RepID=A0ABY4W730_9PROT|nr:formimidoylglutamate deiminase [Sneathiella marina]USG62985.1 formimidoylglutamate deiminase [Sneathiella marina]